MALLVFLIGVAAWASVFVDDGLSRFFKRSNTDFAVAPDAPDETLTEGDEAGLPDATLELAETVAAKLGAGLVKLDPACKINERYAAIDWPVACKGKISGDPAEWCGVDTGKIIADMATYEAKRKLKKEAGKLLDGLLKR